MSNCKHEHIYVPLSANPARCIQCSKQGNFIHPHVTYSDWVSWGVSYYAMASGRYFGEYIYAKKDTDTESLWIF